MKRSPAGATGPDPALVEVAAAGAALAEEVLAELHKRIVGQDAMIERMLIGLFTGGHLLLEGVPGLAKTLAVRTLAETVLLGTMVYDQRTGEFTPKQGPIFANILLADEINRAPAKVQSALLEAMQEKQVTIGSQTFRLREPFLVLATQNPIEQEGTYPLPEAQLDRFELKLRLDYPSRDEEKEILRRMSGGELAPVRAVASPEQVLEARREIVQLYVDDRIADYIVDLVRATRDPDQYGLPELVPLIAYGASPRASIYLTQTARAHAYLRGRAYVIPEDVKAMGPDVLRHRMITTYEAEAEDVTAEEIVRRIFEAVEVP